MADAEKPAEDDGSLEHAVRTLFRERLSREVAKNDASALRDAAERVRLLADWLRSYADKLEVAGARADLASGAWSLRTVPGTDVRATPLVIRDVLPDDVAQRVAEQEAQRALYPNAPADAKRLQVGIETQQRVLNAWPAAAEAAEAEAQSKGQRVTQKAILAKLEEMLATEPDKPKLSAETLRAYAPKKVRGSRSARE